MLFLLFVQSLFQFGAKEGKWEGYYGEKNYLDIFFLETRIRNISVQYANGMDHCEVFDMQKGHMVSPWY